MRKPLTVLLSLIALPLLALAGTWTGTLMDVQCKGKGPATHTRECAINCGKAGLGLVTADGKFLKFDKNGNAKAQAALKAAKDDNLAVEVAGELKGDTIRVTSVQLKSGGSAADHACCGKCKECCGDAKKVAATAKEGCCGARKGCCGEGKKMAAKASCCASKDCCGHCKDMASGAACCRRKAASARAPSSRSE